MKNKLKILFVLQLPPPVHGSSIVGQNIKDSKLINNTFDCKFINSSYSRDMSELGSVSFKKIGICIAIFFKTIEALIIFRPDLCYIAPTVKGFGFYKDLPIIAMFKLFRKKTIFHLHNKGVTQSQDKWIDDKLYRFAFCSTKLILLSERLYDDVKQYVDKNDVFTCPNGISEQVVCKKQSKDAVANLLFLSNMMAAKGVYDLLTACVILKEKELKFRCVFVGKWVDITEDNFEIAVNEKNLSDVVFAQGPKYGKEKVKYIGMANIFIFPTYYHNECFPLVILEAMQHSLPVISTNEGGIPDIIEDGVTGYIVNKQDPQALATKIEELIQNPTLRESMGRAGAEKFLNHYTLEIFEKRIVDILTNSIVE